MNVPWERGDSSEIEATGSTTVRVAFPGEHLARLFWPPVQIQVNEQRLCFKKQTESLKNWTRAVKDEQMRSSNQQLKNILTIMQ